MKITKRVNYSVLLAVFVLFLAIFTSLTPCKTAANVPNPSYSWNSCSLNPDLESNSKILYLGYTESITETYLILTFLTFSITFIILHFFARDKK